MVLMIAISSKWDFIEVKILFSLGKLIYTYNLVVSNWYIIGGDYEWTSVSTFTIIISIITELYSEKSHCHLK